MNVDRTLFTIGDTATTLGTLLLVVAIVIATIPFGQFIYWLIRHRIQRLHEHDTDAFKIYAVSAKLFVWFIGLDAVLHMLGIHLNTMLAASGFIAVGTGFAARDFIANIIAGLILRFEKIIRPGDIIVVDGKWLVIERIRVRITETKTSAGEEIIIPNSTISGSMVENLTRSDRTYRIDLKIGVAYGSDLAVAKKTLEETVDKLDWKSSERISTLYLEEFGNSGVVYRITLWIDDVETYHLRKADALEAFWWALKEKEIAIA
jgi:small-conductance mechanosensitive channel